MYSGTLIGFVATSIFLKSIILSILTLFCIAAFVFRIKIEEDLLKKNLDGYDEYIKKVKYRMIPYCY